MTRQSPWKVGRTVLWFVPIIVVPAAFFASLPWLRQQRRSPGFE